MSSPTYTYKYPRPMVTADVVLFGMINAQPSIMLVTRKNDPFAGSMAFPGGFLEMDEDVHTCAMRELHEETGISDVQLYQMLTVGSPERDPRGRVITVVYSGFYHGTTKPLSGSDAAAVDWYALNKLPELAFDHSEVLVEVCKRWRKIMKHAGRLQQFGIESSFQVAFDLCADRQTALSRFLI